MREPRNLDKFATAEATARWLERLAVKLRENADANPMVLCDVKLTFWNPAWRTQRKQSVGKDT